MRHRFDLNMMKKNILSTLIFLLPFAAISCGSGNDGDSRETPAGEDAAAVQEAGPWSWHLATKPC